jgi:hypothetical protein
MGGRTTLKGWLLVWGVLAVIALASPAIVTAGTFLILPGLVLIAAPTIFLYSAAFSAFRHFLPLPPGWRANLAAAGLALLLGVIFAAPWTVTERLAFGIANVGEVVPAAPVKLAGKIRLELPKRSFFIKYDPRNCNALCAALLDTPGVLSVTVAETGQKASAASVVFSLIPRAGDRSRGEYPVNPEAILPELPNQPILLTHLRDVEGELRAEKKDEQAVAAGWALRLASREKLIADRTASNPDMTVRITDERRRLGGISILRVEILDRSGRALMRRSLVTGSALSAPLRFEGTGSIENFHVALSRDRLRNAPEYPALKPVTELFLHSSLSPPEINGGETKELLDRLRLATNNPALTQDDPDFVLAQLWLPTINWRVALPNDQLDVLSRVIADERIPLPQNLYDGYESNVAPQLRSALGSRILRASTPSQTRSLLARLLSKMPTGTFAILSEDEKRFLGTSDLRRDTYPMVVRLADGGEGAVPELLEILRTDRHVEPWSHRNSVMRAVALGFATLGPKARAALPEVDALVSDRNSGVLNDYDDKKVWNLALARMGKPVEELEFFSNEPGLIARERESLRKQMQHFDPKSTWRY